MSVGMTVTVEIFKIHCDQLKITISNPLMTTVFFWIYITIISVISTLHLYLTVKLSLKASLVLLSVGGVGSGGITATGTSGQFIPHIA